MRIQKNNEGLSQENSGKEIYNYIATRTPLRIIYRCMDYVIYEYYTIFVFAPCINSIQSTFLLIQPMHTIIKSQEC